MKNNKVTIFLIVIFFAGLILLLYPTVSNLWNSWHQTVAISEYTNTVQDLDQAEYDKFLSDAEDYNRDLFIAGGNKFELTEEERIRYNETLKISSKGVMGFIEIPAINVKLPIYHGTDETVLSSGIGHLEGTSLPIGGKNTHSVLSGHRGLPSAKLFTNIDKIREGDRFLITVLDELITYEVDQIRIVLPREIGDLITIPGEDYCTLVTCTPYGVNTHRILVRGHRVANATERSEIRVTSNAIRIEPAIVAPIAAVPIIIILLIALSISNKRSKRKKQIIASIKINIDV